MNSFRKLVCVLGLTMAVASVAFAQNTTQSSTARKVDSSCCSCCGDSCDMKTKDAKKNHVTSSEKQDCCSCCCDSCDMKTKDKKNHVTASDKDGCCSCCGDSCDMKTKDKKNH